MRKLQIVLLLMLLAAPASALLIDDESDNDSIQTAGISIERNDVFAIDGGLFSLEAGDLDYVGLRLHGGIRAMQCGRRAIILEVDNRAREMGKDFALPTVERGALEEIDGLITCPFQICLQPPLERVNRWKRQFDLTDSRMH